MKLNNAKEIATARLSRRGAFAAYRQNGQGGLLSDMYLISGWFDNQAEAAAAAAAYGKTHGYHDGWNAVVGVTTHEAYAEWGWIDRWGLEDGVAVRKY